MRVLLRNYTGAKIEGVYKAISSAFSFSNLNQLVIIDITTF